MRIYSGGIVKEYNSTLEEAVKEVEVAKATPVKRSIKAIPNNSPWFLVILIEILLGLFYSCLFIHIQ